METRVSLLEGEGIAFVKNVDALVLPVDRMLNLRASRSGKELNEADGGSLATRLNDLRRVFSFNTGSITYPETSAIFLTPQEFSCTYFLVSVIPTPSRGASREEKVKGLYSCYFNLFSMAVANNCRSMALPVLGADTKGYDSSILMFALFTSISDFQKTSNFLREICLVTRGKEESERVAGWFNTLAITFGLDFWYKRESFDFSEDNLTLV